MLTPNFVIRNASKIGCRTCGEFHEFYTRGCITIEFDGSNEPDEWGWNGEVVYLPGAHSLFTVSMVEYRSWTRGPGRERPEHCPTTIYLPHYNTPEY